MADRLQPASPKQATLAFTAQRSGGGTGQPFISICAPAFNEQENIGRVAGGWLKMLTDDGLDGEVVITDDGSSDDTAAILAGMATRDSRLKVVTHEGNKGYGKALTSAVRASTGQLVLTIDSDGQFEAVDYRPLLAALEQGGLDLVTGFRVNKQDTRFKVLADRMLNLIVRTMFGVNFKDTNCAIKLGRGEVLRQIRIEAMGYPSPTEVMLRLSRAGARLGEAPVSHLHRAGGASALKPVQTGIKFMFFLFYLRLQFSLGRRKIISRG